MEQVASQLGAAGLKLGLSGKLHGLPFYFIYPRLVTDEARTQTHQQTQAKTAPTKACSLWSQRIGKGTGSQQAALS